MEETLAAIIYNSAEGKMQTRRNARGFTLIELLVALAILGILSGLALMAFNRHRDRGRVAAAVSELRSIESALHAYYASHEAFPPNANQGEMPAGLATLLPSDLFSAGTPIGGVYDWEGPDRWPIAAVSIRAVQRPELIQLIDQYVDDGSLNSGNFRQTPAGAPGLIIQAD